MPTISIIIPIYNTEKYLSQSLDSICNQTFQDLEIICINDGSTDNSLKILKKYAQKDKRIQIIDQNNTGPSGARNAGLKHAKGEFVFFFDSDDYLPDYAIKLLYKIAIKSKAPIVVCEKIKKEKTTQVSENYIIYQPAFKNFVSNKSIFSNACNKLYRSDVLKDHFFVEGIYFEDWPFVTTLFEKIDFYALTKEPCYIYRNDNPSITRSVFGEKKAKSYLTGIYYVYEYFKNKKTLPLAQKRMAIALKMLINKTYHTKDKELKKFVYKEVKILAKEKIIPLRFWNFKTLLRWITLNK